MRFVTQTAPPPARLSAHAQAPPRVRRPCSPCLRDPGVGALARSQAASAIVPGAEVSSAQGAGRRAPGVGGAEQKKIIIIKRESSDALAAARPFPGFPTRSWAQRRQEREQREEQQEEESGSLGGVPGANEAAFRGPGW